MAFRTTLVLVLALLFTGGSLADEIEELTRRGLQLLDANRAAESLPWFERALELDPRNPSLRRNLAIAHLEVAREALRSGHPSRAVDSLQLALAYWSEETEINLWLGVAYYRNREYLLARTEFEHVLRRRPDDAKALEYLGYTHYREERIERAIEAWKRALDLAPENPELQRWLGRAKREIEVERSYRRVEGEHFLLLYEAEELASEARRLLDLCDEAHREVGSDLDHHPSDRITVILYPEGTFREITGSSHWVAGLYDGKIRIPISKVRPDDHEFRRLLLHEVTHAVVHRLDPAAPAWLSEGLAQIEESIPVDAARSRVRRAIGQGEWISFDRLEESFAQLDSPEAIRLAYAESFAFLHEIATRYGKGNLVRILERTGSGLPVSEAFFEVTGSPLEVLLQRFREQLAED